jgi:Zn-dependent metalloprotease
MKNVTALVLALATVAAPAVASARGKVYGSKQGRPLSAPSKAAPADIAADFVRARGKSGLTMASVRATETPGQHNLTFVRMEQVVDGLRVHGAYARAAVNERGELVHMIDNLVPVTGTVKRADITERQALAAALRFLGHDAAAGPATFTGRPPSSA